MFHLNKFPLCVESASERFKKQNIDLRLSERKSLVFMGGEKTLSNCNVIWGMGTLKHTSIVN